MVERELTLYDRILNGFKNNPLFAILLALGFIVAALKPLASLFPASQSSNPQVTPTHASGRNTLTAAWSADCKYFFVEPIAHVIPVTFQIITAALDKKFDLDQRPLNLQSAFVLPVKGLPAGPVHMGFMYPPGANPGGSSIASSMEVEITDAQLYVIEWLYKPIPHSGFKLTPISESDALKFVTHFNISSWDSCN